MTTRSAAYCAAKASTAETKEQLLEAIGACQSSDDPESCSIEDGLWKRLKEREDKELLEIKTPQGDTMTALDIVLFFNKLSEQELKNLLALVQLTPAAKLKEMWEKLQQEKADPEKILSAEVAYKARLSGIQRGEYRE